MSKSTKILSGVCAFALAACMGTTAFAGEITSVAPDNNKETSDVTLNATLPVAPEPTYSVNVKWDDLAFTYTPTNASDWSTTEHEYSTPAGGSWSNGGKGSVVVTNHSDVPVKLEDAYASETGYNNNTENGTTGVKVTYTNFDVTQLAAGDLDNIDGADGDNQDTATVTVTGAPKEAITGVTAGTITVTISAVTA